MHPMNVPATFEVHSLLALPVPELIGGRGVPIGKKWFDPWLCPRSLYPPETKKSMPTVQTIYRVLNVKSAVLYRMRSMIGS